MIDYQLLTIQNPWWTNISSISQDPKYKEFKAASVKYRPKQVLDLPLKKGAINIISGPRQTGKSTALKLLIKQLLAQKTTIESIFYFNCDALDSRQAVIDLVLTFQKSIQGSRGQLPPHYLLLDEISSVKDWPFAVKWLADAGKFEQAKIILTGSSSISLKRSGEFLPGRRQGGQDIKFLPIDFKTYFNLFEPSVRLSDLTSFEQLERFNQRLLRENINLQKFWENFLLTGGFLKTINTFVKQESLAQVVELYISSLKSELAKFGKKEVHARQILIKLISSLTSETSYSNIAEEAELGSKNTAAEYLSFFTDSFLLVELLFYHIAQRKVSVKKNKKYYPTDPLLLWIFQSFISGSNNLETFFQKYSTVPLNTHLAEAFVASELFKKQARAYFSRSIQELDFYLSELDIGIEVKYKSKLTTQDLASLRQAKRKVMVSKNILEQREDVLIIPIYLFSFINWHNFRFK